MSNNNAFSKIPRFAESTHSMASQRSCLELRTPKNRMQQRKSKFLDKAASLHNIGWKTQLTEAHYKVEYKSYPHVYYKKCAICKQRYMLRGLRKPDKNIKVSKILVEKSTPRPARRNIASQTVQRDFKMVNSLSQTESRQQRRAAISGWYKWLAIALAIFSIPVAISWCNYKLLTNIRFKTPFEEFMAYFKTKEPCIEPEAKDVGAYRTSPQIGLLLQCLYVVHRFVWHVNNEVL